jgi:alkaline phosphatase
VALAATVAIVPLASTPAAADVPTAKNIIVLISDGAGYNHFDAANLYETGTALNQVLVDPVNDLIERVPGQATQVYDSYPVQVAQSHYSANGQASYSSDDAWGTFNWVYNGATDSAAAATALGTGVKTNNGMLGYTPSSERLVTIGEHSLALGKAVGLVTTVSFNHATPAGFIAHNSNRNDYHGLATEMIDSDLTVVMGAGHPLYNDANEPRTPYYQWISQADYERVSSGQTPYSYVESMADFEALAAGGDVPDRVFGLAQVAEVLQYNRPGLANNNVLPFTDPYNDVPSLATMAQGALNVLEKDSDGFFLMVEGGAVDWAGHANQTTRLIEEQLDFNAAVEIVDAWVEANSSWDETLVIITADHETGYLSGPGADPTWTPMTGVAGQLPNVSWHSGNHTNSLVPVFAKGAGSDLIAARATGWDRVRGAYIDNTDIGKTLFDLFGYDYSGGTGVIPLEAAIGMDTAPPGTLSLKVAPLAAPVSFAASGVNQMRASLPAVTVIDTRSQVQAQAGGWHLTGRAADFTAGNRVIEASNLSWQPAIAASENGATAGPAATLDTSATLAEADDATRVGTTVVGANLALTTTAAPSGRYGSEIVLSLFAKD